MFFTSKRIKDGKKTGRRYSSYFPLLSKNQSFDGEEAIILLV